MTCMERHYAYLPSGRRVEVLCDEELAVIDRQLAYAASKGHHLVVCGPYPGRHGRGEYYLVDFPIGDKRSTETLHGPDPDLDNVRRVQHEYQQRWGIDSEGELSAP